VLMGDIHNTSGPGIAELEFHFVAFVAVLLAMIEVLEYRVFDEVGDAVAVRAVFPDQRDDPTRCVRYASMVVRSLPEPPAPAADAGAAALRKREVGTPDQRAVTKYPDAIGCAQESPTDTAKARSQSCCNAGVIR
jgi:hypothetical protein